MARNATLDQLSLTMGMRGWLKLLLAPERCHPDEAKQNQGRNHRETLLLKLAMRGLGELLARTERGPIPRQAKQ